MATAQPTARQVFPPTVPVAAREAGRGDGGGVVQMQEEAPPAFNGPKFEYQPPKNVQQVKAFFVVSCVVSPHSRVVPDLDEQHGSMASCGLPHLLLAASQPGRLTPVTVLTAP